MATVDQTMIKVQRILTGPLNLRIDLEGERIGVRFTDVSTQVYVRVIDWGKNKDGEPRTVHLIPPAIELLERWTAHAGVQAGDSAIFPAPRGGGRINGQYLSRRVAAAGAGAGIADVGEGGRKRKPFHAFRASYVRLCREQGLDPQWVQFQLGHSDPDLTLNVYGRWSDVAMQAEASRAAGFPV